MTKNKRREHLLEVIDMFAEQLIAWQNEQLLELQKTDSALTDAELGEVNINSFGEAVARALASTAFHSGNDTADLYDNLGTLVRIRCNDWLAELRASNLKPGDRLGLDIKAN